MAYRPMLEHILPSLMALCVRALMGSIKVLEVFGGEHLKEALAMAEGKVIYATWHQRMSYHFYHFSKRGIFVLISPSRDGELAARLAQRLGFSVVRGSSSRDGVRGLMGMVREIKKGNSAGMLADGPLGPARVAKLGTVAMAWLSGAPIIPVVWGVDRCWIMNSWDRYMIPKPFSRAVIHYGEPILVPKGSNREGLEAYRRLLEDSLNRGTGVCDEYFGVVRPWRKEG